MHEINQSRGQRDDGVEVVIPNLSWRYSGGTATNQAIAPALARLMRVAWLGSDRPDGVTPLMPRDLMRLRARPSPVVWHARRNIEMAAGLLLKSLGWPFVLIFTSAGQRHHKAITRWMIKQVDAVIAPSAASASFAHRPATVIHHGVDPARYAPAADRAAEWAAGGLPGRYGIGCFGRIRPQKGTDLFVTAMCRLLPRYPDYTAVVIGATTASHRAFAARLRAEAAAAGLADRILFLGALPTPEVQRWFARLSIYAFTSRNEGFGLTLLEAMAAGAALVAARAGAAEVVVADRRTGLLVPPGDIDALAAALETLMRDPAATAAMGRRARERAVTEFSLDAEVAGIAKLYRAVRSGGRS
ncbi:MAG TPA: glycosyltransferase family 4 protein [Xanthobacteraceae bacterium]|nr:glycosyltransferase family 4 protein [Xanthobacteraceae bacterium]